MKDRIIAAKNSFFRIFGTENDGFRYVEVDETNQGADWGEPSEIVFRTAEEAIAAATDAGGGPFEPHPPWMSEEEAFGVEPS